MTEFQIGCGLLNLGNSCFLNATFQALFHIPKVANCFQLESENMTKSICANRENCVTCKVLILFNDTRNNFPARSPRQLYNVLRKTNRRFSKLLDGKMQDAHEFLKLLAEQMETEAHPLKWLDAFFVADIRVSIKCSTCGNVCETTGLLGDVTLDVGHKSIQTALNTYFAWESVNDYDCQCCKRKVAAKKRISLISSPSCLCITLKRFSENRRKINRKIQIDLGLSTNGYFDAGPTNSGDCKYKLTSAINHVGQNIYSGHYTATICSPDTAFYEFDDTTVRVLNGNGVKENDAYILFYECTKEPDKEDTQNRSQEFLYKEHEVQSINSSPMWNVDLTEWDGIEVEVIDESDQISDLQEVALNSIHFSHKVSNGNKPVGEHTLPVIRKHQAPNDYEKRIETAIGIETFGEELHRCSDNENLNTFEEQSETDSERETKPKQKDSDTESENEIGNRNIADESYETDSEYETIDAEIKCSRQNISDEDAVGLTGRRIVDINYLLKQIMSMSSNTCNECGDGVMIFEGEIKHALISIFKFRCTACGRKKRIESCHTKQSNKANVNESAISGIVSIGLGHYHLQEFLAHLNIQSMTYPTYHELDRKFQKHAWALAKKLEEEHLQEEIRIARETGQVDSAGNALITVEFDGSWGKRSYGKNYSSLSGCAAIIGLRTNKILYSDVKSKYCHTCKMAQSRNAPPNKHDCNKNYDGPSSGMETQIVVEGFIHCASKGARFNKYVGDGDSSTYKALRDLRLYKDPELEIEKFECVNHLFRNFWRKFDDLLDCTTFCLRGRKVLSSSLGGEICVGVRKAAEYWRKSDVDLVDKCTNLERDILNAPLHYLGVHDKCQRYYCDKKTDPSVQNTISTLKDTGLFYQIMDLCQNYFANNAKSLIANLCTNKTEGFNSLIAKTLGGKRVCNSLAGSYKSRTAVSAIQHNTGGHFGSKFHEFAYGEPLETCVKLENSRKRKVNANAIAQQSKPKKTRFTKAPKNKNKGKQKIRYGPGREDVDISPSSYQTAESRLLNKLRENQINRETVEIETRGLHLNQKWIVVRKDLLTPSYFGRILNANSRKSYTKIVEDILYKNDRFSNTAESRHQRMFELEALEMFFDLYGSESVIRCGIFIDTEFAFLGTSPFRLYNEDGIICVKCPKAAYKKSMKEAITKKLIPLWKGSVNDRQINEKSRWYYEIQGQLRICNRKIAHLVIYLGERVYEIIEIERNDAFWKTRMEKELVFFYKEAMIKEIVDSRDSKGMDLRVYNASSQKFE